MECIKYKYTLFKSSVYSGYSCSTLNRKFTVPDVLTFNFNDVKNK